MELKTIKINGGQLFINNEAVTSCLVTKYQVENNDTEGETAAITITLVAPKADVFIAGLSLD